MCEVGDRWKEPSLRMGWQRCGGTMDADCCLTKLLGHNFFYEGLHCLSGSLAQDYEGWI